MIKIKLKLLAIKLAKKRIFYFKAMVLKSFNKIIEKYSEKKNYKKNLTSKIVFLFLHILTYFYKTI